MTEKNVWSVTLALLSTLAADAAPTEADWARCAAFAADGERLACYDALYHHQPQPGATGTMAATAPAPAPKAAQRTAANAPTARLPYDPNSFGFTPEQQHLLDPGPASISVRITSITESQFAPTLISLDNNQTWSVMDNDGRLSSGDIVRIKHAAMGAFIMLTRSNHTYHVKRLR